MTITISLLTFRQQQPAAGYICRSASLKYNMSKGVTLIELMVAVALLGVILLTAATLDIAARKFFNASDRVAEMQCEVNPVLLRIKKDINQVSGSINDSGIFIEIGPTRLRFRNGSGVDGVYLTADDTWGAYVWNTANATIEYYSQTPAPPAAFGNPAFQEIVSAGVIDFTLTTINDFSPPIVNYPVTLAVSITSCYDAGETLGPCGSNNNPQITLATSAHALAQSAR